MKKAKVSRTEKLQTILKSGKAVTEKTVKFASGNSFRSAISSLRKIVMKIPKAVNGKYTIKTKKK